MIAGNASTSFLTNLLSASTSLSKIPLSFGGELSVPSPPPPETPVMARTIVAIIIEKAASIEDMVIPCSLNRVQILSSKDVFLSRTFSMVCLILATCV